MSESVAASIETRLNELAAFPTDGEYLIEEMTAGAMATASIILNAMRLETRPMLFRTPGGGVSIEWATEDTIVFLEIPPNAPEAPPEFFFHYQEGDTLTPTPESVILAPSPVAKRMGL